MVFFLDFFFFFSQGYKKPKSCIGGWCGTVSTRYEIVNQLKYGDKPLDFLSLTYFNGLSARYTKFALFS